MDAAVIGTAVGSLLAGGILGSLATIYATRKESSDRKDALALERERLDHDKSKWEYERDKPKRDREREVLESGVESLGGALKFLTAVHNEPQLSKSDEVLLVRSDVREFWILLNHYRLEDVALKVDQFLNMYDRALSWNDEWIDANNIRFAWGDLKDTITIVQREIGYRR